MKFFSVFVVCVYVRSVYSYYTGPSNSPYPVVPSNIYPTSNLQNTNQQSRPELVTSRLPVNVKNAYPGVQENIQNQAIPIQYEYRIGPGLPIPYEATQLASGLKNNVQKYPAPNNGGIPPGPALHHIAYHPYLKEMYKASLPKKRYTIVHPNGTIEHTDEIHAVTARYPNYLMVKAADILSHMNQPNAYRETSKSLLPSQLNQSVKTNNENHKWTSINSYESSNNIQLQNNSFGSPVVSDRKPDNKRYSNHKPQETVRSTDIPSNFNVISLNPAVPSLNETDIKQNIQEVNKVANVTQETISEQRNNNSSITQTLSNNTVAANPLPIYPASSVSDVIEKKTVQPFESSAANSSNAVKILDSNFTDSNNNQTKPIRAVIKIPAEINETTTLEILLPEIVPQNTIEETETPTTIDEPVRSTNKPEVTTIEEPIAPQSTNLSIVKNDTSSSLSKLISVSEPNLILNVSQSREIDENIKLVNTSITPENITNKIETVQEIQTSTDVKDNSTVLLQNSTAESVSNQSSILGKSAPLTWFQLSEDSVWKAIQNNASNVYFFFLPQKPKRVKKTRTTIFPNGTTVEEIIETDVDQDQDGIPEVTNNTTIVDS